jgi:hypothetical protein
MSAYAFKAGRVEGNNGFKAEMTQVSLEFDEQPSGLRIIGKCRDIHLLQSEQPERVQIYFDTTTSNCGVQKGVTIKLNSCSLTGNTFEAHADDQRNVFTLTMAEDAA